jgi:hypothetical protein
MSRRAERRDAADQQGPQRKGDVSLAHAEIDGGQDSAADEAADGERDGIDHEILEDDKGDRIEQAAYHGEQGGTSTEALKTGRRLAHYTR